MMPTRIGRPKATIFLLDDHALVREHLTALIEEEADLAVGGEAEDAPTALALITRLKPDLVLLDISLKRSNGLDLLKDLKRLQPKPAVLILSMHEATLYAERALQAGALGYITKEDATTNILTAIRRVLAGEVYVSDRIASQMREQLSSDGPALTAEVRV